MAEAVYKIVAHNGGWGVLHEGIESEAALEAVVDSAEAALYLAANTTDDKEAAALLELAAEQIALAESEIAPQLLHPIEPTENERAPNPATPGFTTMAGDQNSSGMTGK
jgi:hypothetical protein